MKRKGITIATVLALSLALMLTGVGAAYADSFHFFSVDATAPTPGGSGWYAGYVIHATTSPVTTTLTITAKGNIAYPFYQDNLTMLISNAAAAGGITKIVISALDDSNHVVSQTFTPSDFTADPNANYGPIYIGSKGNAGGPFSQTGTAPQDYYGYNNSFQMAHTSALWSNNQYSITVTVTFAPGANSNSLVWFGAVGYEYNNSNPGTPGQYLFTPFSEGVLFVLPEYVFPLMGIGASFAAFAVFKKLKH